MININMKKLIVIILFFVVNIDVFSQINIPNFIRNWYDDECIYVGYNNQLYECVGYNKTYRNITRLCYIDNYGYLRINYKIGDTSWTPAVREEPYHLILSPRQLFIFMRDSSFNSPNNNLEEILGYNPFGNIFISSIKSNVYLKENALEYSPRNFLKRFFVTDQVFPYDYWSKTLPLAVTNEQMNIFEMEIIFQENVEGILLLNGFVDFYRPHLYKDNRRIRELKIIDNNSRIEKNYTIEDRIEFQELRFPQLTNSITIKIVSFYEGNRFTDICCSSIIPIYNESMFRRARQWINPDYDSFIKEMLEIYKEIK
jgi:hypothetical protein